MKVSFYKLKSWVGDHAFRVVHNTVKNVNILFQICSFVNISNMHALFISIISKL